MFQLSSFYYSFSCSWKGYRFNYSPAASPVSVCHVLYSDPVAHTQITSTPEALVTLVVTPVVALMFKPLLALRAEVFKLEIFQ